MDQLIYTRVEVCRSQTVLSSVFLSLIFSNVPHHSPVVVGKPTSSCLHKGLALGGRESSLQH